MKKDALFLIAIILGFLLGLFIISFDAIMERMVDEYSWACTPHQQKILEFHELKKQENLEYSQLQE